ncbi:hypothetical protein LCI18_009718 [Fusarium solani-melongenae]|uniref:Uncharacterized protein n=1 Tax=Fusarium solani subsp. cucurbitae TaxID=2747967 RepID=A0ACD3ZBW6_FUSSC|nr:hypothetical protein LCI18_009718 [Fusarium solani-melongenae]
MLSHTLKAAKADLRKSEPLVSSEDTISPKPAKRSLLNTLFDTKSGRKLHKRSRSDPASKCDPAGQLPELELVLRPYEDARVFSVGTNQALDAVFESTVSSREYHSCTSGSYDASYEIDDWSISDHGTVLIRRPAGFYPTRSASLISHSTHHTVYEEPVTPSAEAECSPEIGVSTYHELIGAINKELPNADVQVAETPATAHENVADNDAPISVADNIISDSEAHDDEPSDDVQESSGNHNPNMGSRDNNLDAHFVQPVSMTQISRVMSKVIEGRTKKNLILRPIKELRRMHRTVSGSSKKTRKTEHGARRFFLTTNKATITPIVDEHDDAVPGPAPESIHESLENDQDANNSTHVDEDAVSQPHADEEPFHQLSTHESTYTGSTNSIHENLAQCDMILAAYQGEYDQLERGSTHTSDLCDTLDPNDVDARSEHGQQLELTEEKTEPKPLEFTKEKAELESWAQASTHWGDPNIGPDTVRQGFEEHLKIMKRLHTSDAKGKNIKLNPSINMDHQSHPAAGLPEGKNNSAKCRDMLALLLKARKEEETRIERDLDQARERIDARAAQLERFCAHARQLEEKNEEKAASLRRAIYRKVSQVIKNVEAGLEQAMTRCVEKREHYRELLYREKALVEAVQDEARHLGLGNHTPNELEWAVEQMVAGDSLEFVEEALNSCF